MANRKNEQTEILSRREQAVRLRIDGQSYQQIANTLGVSKGTAFSDIQAIHEEWTQANLENIDALKRQELARLQQIELDAWEQWERSKLDSERVRTVTDASGVVIRTERTVGTQSGDSRLLGLVLKCVEQRRKILGLDAPVRAAVSHSVEYGPQPGDPDLFSILRERIKERDAMKAG